MTIRISLNHFVDDDGDDHHTGVFVVDSYPGHHSGFLCEKIIDHKPASHCQQLICKVTIWTYSIIFNLTIWIYLDP